MADTALDTLLRRNVWQSGAINGAFSLAFFLVVFGLPGHALAMGQPDGFAFDFLPQSAAVGLMSALVPVLATRARVSQLTGRRPAAVRPIVLRAVVFALACLVPGGALAGMAIGLPWPALTLVPALAIKIVYGAILGAVVTPLAIKRSIR